MAKQKGFIKLKDLLGGLTFYKSSEVAFFALRVLLK
jgi:hypothetical protein